MFSENDYVVFGTHGICQVKAVGSLTISAADEERLYYTLKPVYESQQSAIYTPVDNTKAPIRAAVSREEVFKLIDEIPEIETIWVLDEKRREEKYKEIMLKNECRGWIQIIKTLYLKKQKRLAEGKKNTSKDDFYLKLAEELLYGEMASVTEMEKAEVKDMVTKRVRELGDNPLMA